MNTAVDSAAPRHRLCHRLLTLAAVALLWAVAVSAAEQSDDDDKGRASNTASNPGEPRATEEPQPATAAALELAGSLLGVIQSTSGASDDTATGVGRLELELAAEYTPETNLYVAVESIGGDGPGVNCSSFSELNANAGSTQAADGADRLHVREAWVELSHGPATVTIGKLDLTVFVNANVFANDERTQFLSGAFTNDISIILPRDGYTPGACLVYSSGGWTLTLAAASDDNSGDQFFDELVGIAELGFSHGGEGRQGNIRAHAAVDGAGEDAAGRPARDVSYGLSLDQELGRSVGLFARYGSRETDAVDAEVESAWSAGLELHAFHAARAADTIGIGYGEVTSVATGTTEKLFEVYYRAPLSDRAAVSVHVQILSDALCDPAADTVTAFGVRSQLTF